VQESPTMTKFEPRDPNYVARIHSSFDRQRVMETIEARLTRVEPGLVEIELPYREDLTQQHGYLHAGISTTIADSAGGYAAYSLMPADSSVLAVEFKVNLLRPATSPSIACRAEVVKPGRQLSVVQATARESGGERKVGRHGTASQNTRQASPPAAGSGRRPASPPRAGRRGQGHRL